MSYAKKRFILICALALTPSLFGGWACSQGFQAKSFSSGSASQSLISSSEQAKACVAQSNVGRTMIRRLSNTEYNNTVRDLLLTTARPADRFQSTPVGGTGFSSEAISLALSDQMIFDYAAAAEQLARDFISQRTQSNSALSRLANCFLQTTVTNTCAESVVRNFVSRAFREPASPADVSAMMSIYTNGGGGLQGLNDVLVALLIHPRFLFLNYTGEAGPTTVSSLSAHQFASRLSYLIWQSMPDQTLSDAAASGLLTSPTTLRAQIVRMLRDSKSRSLATVLRNEYSQLGAVDALINSSMVDPALGADVARESQLFFEDLVANDRSFMDVVNGRYTFVNSRLAGHYGWTISGVGSEFQRVQIPDAHRRGVLTQAGFLMVRGGLGPYTHPVPRGRWIAKNLFCSEPQTPPANIPPIATTGNQTMRERLAVHSQGSCAGCHRIMDPAGLALEVYDPLGRYRTAYSADGINPSGASIDASGRFDSPQINFANAGEMLEGLAQTDTTRTCMSRGVLNLALNRAANAVADTCVARSIGQAALTPNAKLSELIFQIVTSPQFQLQGAEAL